MISQAGRLKRLVAGPWYQLPTGMAAGPFLSL